MALIGRSDFIWHNAHGCNSGAMNRTWPAALSRDPERMKPFSEANSCPVPM
jgi:hypothetical protein